MNDSGGTRPPTNGQIFLVLCRELWMALGDIKDWIVDWLKDCCTPRR
jgi:hypothetical protein